MKMKKALFCSPWKIYKKNTEDIKNILINNKKKKYTDRIPYELLTS